MRKLYILILLVGMGAAAKAQQIPLYTQYFYNEYIYNPAKAGTAILPNVFLAHRIQWTGLEGAPQTTLFSADMMIPQHRSGVGMNIIRDQIHLTTRYRGMFSYAYHLKFSNSSLLSMGMSAGFNNYTFDMAKAYGTGYLDLNDPLLANQNASDWTFEASAGVDLRLGRFHIGAVAPQLFSTDPAFGNADTSNVWDITNHWLGFTKYVWFLNRDHRIEPMVMVRYVDGIDPQIDAGVLYTYNHTVWGGLSYRQDYAVTASTGLQVHSGLRIGYSFDLPIGDIAGYVGTTHEIMVGMRFGDDHSKDYITALEDIDPAGGWPEVLVIHPKHQQRHAAKQRKRLGHNKKRHMNPNKSARENRKHGHQHWWQFWKGHTYK